MTTDVVTGGVQLATMSTKATAFTIDELLRLDVHRSADRRHDIGITDLGLQRQNQAHETVCGSAADRRLFTGELIGAEFNCTAGIGGKEGYKQFVNFTSPLREITYHMGSHSVACHPAEVTLPPLPLPKPVLDLATPKGYKAELTWVEITSLRYSQQDTPGK